MLKMTRLSRSAPKRAEDEVIAVGGSRADEMMRNLSKSKKSKNKHISTIGAIQKPTFLNPSTKEVFNYLRQVFIKAPILQHFDLESYIQIKINVSNYAIGRVFSQLSFD